MVQPIVHWDCIAFLSSYRWFIRLIFTEDVRWISGTAVGLMRNPTQIYLTFDPDLSDLNPHVSLTHYFGSEDVHRAIRSFNVCVDVRKHTETIK